MERMTNRLKDLLDRTRPPAPAEARTGWERPERFARAEQAVLARVPADLRPRVAAAVAADRCKDEFEKSPIAAFIDRPTYGFGDGVNGHFCAPLPDAFPRQLIEFLLAADPGEVVVGASCGTCGLSIPALTWREGRTRFEDRTIFKTCPTCGAETGGSYRETHAAEAEAWRRRTP